MIRLNLLVEDEIPAMLTELAGGERKRGEKVSELVRSLYAARSRQPAASQADRIEHELAGVAGRIRELDGRVTALERMLGK